MTDLFERSKWFREARFGMFLHWGLYAIPGRGEWVRSNERISSEVYDKYLYQFDPEGYSPREWAARAKAAGMKYMVLTARHHDSFCLFNTATTDFNSVTACGRDLVKEFVEAVRDAGLKVGLYYSLIDWRHPDYPKYGDLYHPMRENEAYKNEEINFERYLDFMHAQIKELVTNYGKIDILWFDYAYGDLRGEAWRGSELVEMVRKYQPDVILDNRLETSGEGFGSLVEAQPGPCSGDFVSPEQIIPPDGIRNVFGNPVPWELCTTMNNNWGYNPSDPCYKSPKLLIRKLVECVSKGGNMILNVGPDAKGRFNQPSCEILKTIGVWMERNGESIYGCGYADLPKPDWGRYTRSGNVIYAHVFEPSIGPLALPGIKREDVRSVTLLCDGSELYGGDSFTTMAYEGLMFVNFGAVPYYSYPLPDDFDTVIRIELRKENE